MDFTLKTSLVGLS